MSNKRGFLHTQNLFFNISNLLCPALPPGALPPFSNRLWDLLLQISYRNFHQSDVNSSFKIDRNTKNSLFLHRFIEMNVGIIWFPWKPGSLRFYRNKIKTLQWALHPWRPNPDQTWHFPKAHLTCPILFPPATEQEQRGVQPSRRAEPRLGLFAFRFFCFITFFFFLGSIYLNARASLCGPWQDLIAVSQFHVLARPHAAAEATM